MRTQSRLCGNFDADFSLNSGPSKNPDAYSTTINLLPGTHYLKFIIGGDMCTSDHLPTTVDYTNILVNYIEVSPDDVPTPPPSEPVPIPGKGEPAEPPKPEEIPPDLHPPQVLPPQFQTPPAPTPAPAAPAPEQSTPKQMAETAAPVEKGPTKQYHSDIPRFLLDLDAPEESSRFHRANAVVSTLPAPPSLPGFLGKSILNGSTPMKDDSSVLNMPNHTVLNHLATSSIKANVLATSATTRYRKKVRFNFIFAHQFPLYILKSQISFKSMTLLLFPSVMFSRCSYLQILSKSFAMVSLAVTEIVTPAV